MNIIRRLYLSDFFRLLLLISLGFSAVFSLLDLIGRIDEFQITKPSVGVLVLYAFYSIPKFFLYMLPMSVLICSLFTFSQAAKRKELVAIRAAGGRLFDLFYPFVISGALLSIIAFFISEFVAPDFALRSAALRARLEGKENMTTVTENAIWIKDRKGNPVRIEIYLPEKKRAENISIFVHGADFLGKIISAKYAVWAIEKKQWVMQDVSIYENETGRTKRLKQMTYPELDSPEIFFQQLHLTDEMGITELYRYTQKLKAAGINNLKLVVNLNAKISFPLINAFMMLLGVSLSGRSGRGGGLFVAGLGLGLSIIYWLSYTFTLSLGYAGILPPAVASWSVPFLFGSLSLYLFIKTPE